MRFFLYFFPKFSHFSPQNGRIIRPFWQKKSGKISGKNAKFYRNFLTISQCTWFAWWIYRHQHSLYKNTKKPTVNNLAESSESESSAFYVLRDSIRLPPVLTFQHNIYNRTDTKPSTTADYQKYWLLNTGKDHGNILRKINFSQNEKFYCLNGKMFYDYDNKNLILRKMQGFFSTLCIILDNFPMMFWSEWNGG